MPTRRHILLTLAAAPFAAGLPVFAQAPGKDYKLVEPPQPTDAPGKIEVIEFFWYGCPHCFALQPSLKAWLKKKPADVAYTRIPAVFSQSWVAHARLYYTLDALGEVDRLHDQVFNAIHLSKLRLADRDSMADWAAARGIDRQKFLDTFNSVAVENRTRRAIDTTKAYNLDGTPSIAIQGRYVTSPAQVFGDAPSDMNKFWQIVDQIIAMARKGGAAK
ncbi:MAG: thiol:disulfide interchange protein DsbA/DsbL [Burkholderiales bacterium]